MALEFIVPGDVMRLSPNKRLHHMARHRLTQSWKSCAWMAWAQAGRVQLEGKVRITYTLYRGRMVDPDNAMAATKALLDGLRDEPGRPGMLAGDTSRHVEFGPIQQITGACYKSRESVRVSVELLGEES